MSPATAPASSAHSHRRRFFWAATILFVAVFFLFARSFQQGQALFSNDGPLGINHAEANSLPRIFTGAWLDVYWLGINAGSAPPDFTYGLFWSLGSVGLAKFYPPVALFLLGLCAWFFFRRLGFNQITATLGGIAAALNMNFFSNACWGLPSRALLLGTTFLALGALIPRGGRRGWWLAVLAGFAVGMGIMEAADNGAIFSLYVAAFALFIGLIGEGNFISKLITGPLRVALVAVCAAFIAAHALTSLVSTQIQGISGLEQNAQSKERRWDEATQWSLPKIETLRVIIPGLFGYRTAEPDGSQYWGAVGRTPGWDQHHMGIPRHSGSGEYTGILVVCIALWGLFQSFSRQSSASFTSFERKVIWFWAVAALISLIMGFGRHAPLYQFFYALPYFSTIRNPIKFLHAFQMAMLILFGFGLHGLSKLYLDKARAKTSSFLGQIQKWWSTATTFEKRWTIGSLIAAALSGIGFLIYSNSRREIIEALAKNGFDGAQADSIARFSTGEVGIFALFLTLSVAAILFIMSGNFAGPRAKWAGLILGLILVIDLARADIPWIKYYNYKETYALNPVLDFLKDKPNEHRVIGQLAPLNPAALANNDQVGSIFRNLYGEWIHYQFPFYNIQSLDFPQFPRMPEIDTAYLRAFTPTNDNQLYLFARLWQLTNTRYIFGMGGFLEDLNRRFDPGKKSFSIRLPFTFVPKPGITQVLQFDQLTVQPNPQGPVAIFEYGDALPRAKLFANWQINTNGTDTLRQLTDPNFDANATVLVMDNIPVSSAGPVASVPKPVEFLHYEPKQIELKTQAEVPTVLLLNDKFDPTWKVFVDGKPEKLLRCNFIMRGVALSAGPHQVVFRFQPNITGLYISLAAIVAGFALLGFLVVSGRSPKYAGTADPKKVARR